MPVMRVSASVTATASARIIRPAVITFDAPMHASVRAHDARPQMHRDEAGTVWAQFQ